MNDLGGCKHVYANQAFEDGSLHWDKPGSLIPQIQPDTPRAEVIVWLREAHNHLRGHVAAFEVCPQLLDGLLRHALVHRQRGPLRGAPPIVTVATATVSCEGWRSLSGRQLHLPNIHAGVKLQVE